MAFLRLKMEGDENLLNNIKTIILLNLAAKYEAIFIAISQENC